MPFGAQIGGPRRLLIVDDEPAICEALVRVLRLEGYAISTARDGESALALLERTAFGVLLTDMRMPGMNGARLLAHVATQHPSTVRVLLTGHADLEAAVSAINEGQVFRYLTKPWDDAQLRAAGFSARSAFLRSSTFGGFSWLAHGSVQAGVWVDSKRRYDQLVTGNRLTLATAFKRAGWRTLAIDPANDRAWPEGSTFYHLDAVYDRRNVGYRGPRYAFAPMPDQYVLTALQRLELSRRPRRNIFAEVDLISSHEPWTRIPRLVPWNRVGDGAVFNDQPSVPTRSSGGFGDATGVQRDYGHSIEYSLRTLFSFVRRAHDPNLVLVVLGDHQPNAVVTGENPSTHDVPISVIAHDPAVLARIRGWRWRAGTRPDPTAPVWPMDAFRDRFLRAFGPTAARRVTPRTGAAGPACARPCAPSSPGSGRSPANGARRSAPAG